MIRKWFDKKVLILGLSKSGIAAAKYLNSKGADCYITEKKPFDPKDEQIVKELNDILERLKQFPGNPFNISRELYLSEGDFIKS